MTTFPMTALILSVCLATVDPGPDPGQAEEAFERGNALYLEGNFEAALAVYETALEFEIQPGLFYYNGGNCHFKLGRFGEALYYYHSARPFLPRYPGVIRNIDTARWHLGFSDSSDFGYRKKIGDIVKAFRPAEYFVATALVACPALLLWAYHLLRRSRAAKSLALLWACLALLHFFLAVAVSVGLETRWGLAVIPCEVLSEPSPSAGKPLFSLREGEEIRLEESLRGWHRVRDGEDRRGWVRFGEVRPLP